MVFGQHHNLTSQQPYKLVNRTISPDMECRAGSHSRCLQWIWRTIWSCHGHEILYITVVYSSEFLNQVFFKPNFPTDWEKIISLNRWFFSQPVCMFGLKIIWNWNYYIQANTMPFLSMNLFLLQNHSTYIHTKHDFCFTWFFSGNKICINKEIIHWLKK